MTFEYKHNGTDYPASHPMYDILDVANYANDGDIRFNSDFHSVVARNDPYTFFVQATKLG